MKQDMIKIGLIKNKRFDPNRIRRDLLYFYVASLTRFRFQKVDPDPLSTQYFNLYQYQGK